jgi:hypothetical protein
MVISVAGMLPVLVRVRVSFVVANDEPTSVTGAKVSVFPEYTSPAPFDVSVMLIVPALMAWLLTV